MLSSVSLRHLRAFIAVAECGSFTRAANMLGLTPPTLTATIRQFEDIVGMPLFDRTTRQVALSAGGARFLPVARRLIADFDMALEDLDAQSKGLGGKVVVAAAPSVLTRILPQIIVAFHAAHPDASLRLDEMNAGEVHDAVAKGEVDFGIAGDWRALPDIHFQPLFSDTMGVVCRHDHPLAARDQVSWHELADHPFVGLGPESGTGAILAQLVGQGERINRLSSANHTDPEIARADEALKPRSIRVMRPVVETSNTVTLCAMVAAGIGITILPELAARVEASRDLAFVPLKDPVRERHIGMISRKSRSLSPIAAIFRDLVLEYAPSIPLAARLRWHIPG
ncbi:LysR family transcriptional regulator [Thalassospira profundimaris]|uniref:LysR family transcriptional regulator n=1 Tax=Thalassospira profundimaris TaxID=502049 RepID=A0A367X4S7_9PROT|nr:LysR family transcriptional regulator [Thalassospira profundimaris]RCK48645.1 LysR family transcriptional regulator [Thalassospira profundimaris]